MSYSDCTLTIMSTGGMRNLRERSQKVHNRLESGIFEYLRTVPFKPPRYETISGKKEALYGWIAANYVSKHPPSPGLGIWPGLAIVGYMTMGGATLQIAYQPAANELLKLEGGKAGRRRNIHGGLVRVAIWGQQIDSFVMTFALGSDTAWAGHNTALMRGAGDRKDPCRPTGCPKLDGKGKDTGESVVGEYNQNL